ncbi:MFS transporter [Cellvibrio mixtus]|uniref:MFS transporter n=2 Tax=Cellvibrionaceae TaxID=1706371 RepID=A0A266Q5U0_9GAMM|nr:MFS transporter [Cellvibrio mixtus]
MLMSLSFAQQAIPYWRLSGFYFFYFAVVGALIPYWGIYLKSLGYSSQDVGIISAIILATRIVAPNFWGWLADRTQQRLRIIRVGSLLASIIFAGVMLDSRYWWLVLVVSCYTFFWHAVLPQFEVITLGYLGNNYSRYGQIRLWGSMGFMAAVVGLGWVFDLLPIRYLPLFILSFLILIWLSSLSLKDMTGKKTASASEGFLSIVKQPTVLCFLLASFLLQFSHGPYYTFYTLYLVENYDYSRSATGLLWALGVLAEVAIFIVMFKLLQRFTLRTLLLFSLLVSMVRWLLIGYCADSLWVLLFAQLMHACSFGIAHSVSIELVRNYFAGGHQGQGQALYSSFSFGAGGAAGALAGGLLWDYSASLTFLLAAISVGMALVLCYFWLHPAHQTLRGDSQ